MITRVLCCYMTRLARNCTVGREKVCWNSNTFLNSVFCAAGPCFPGRLNIDQRYPKGCCCSNTFSQHAGVLSNCSSVMPLRLAQHQLYHYSPEDKHDGVRRKEAQAQLQPERSCPELSRLPTEDPAQPQKAANLSLLRPTDELKPWYTNLDLKKRSRKDQTFRRATGSRV